MDRQEQGRQNDPPKCVVAKTRGLAFIKPKSISDVEQDILSGLPSVEPFVVEVAVEQKVTPW
jgi:hypothetical protein